MARVVWVHRFFGNVGPKSFCVDHKNGADRNFGESGVSPSNFCVAKKNGMNQRDSVS